LNGRRGICPGPKKRSNGPSNSSGEPGAHTRSAGPTPQRHHLSAGARRRDVHDRRESSLREIDESGSRHARRWLDRHDGAASATERPPARPSATRRRSLLDFCTIPPLPLLPDFSTKRSADRRGSSQQAGFLSRRGCRASCPQHRDDDVGRAPARRRRSGSALPVIGFGMSPRHISACVLRLIRNVLIVISEERPGGPPARRRRRRVVDRRRRRSFAPAIRRAPRRPLCGLAGLG